MKKKIINTILGIILGMAFLYAAVFAVGQYHTDEEETKKELKIKVPKALTPYEIGEEVQVGDFLWKVSEAELIDNYEKLDDYYKQRKYLKAPQPNQQNPFVEEQRFLRVKFSVQNTNKKKEAEFSFSQLEYANYWGEGIFEKWELAFMSWYPVSYANEFGGSEYAYLHEYRYFDGKCEIRDSLKPVKYFENLSNIMLAPGEVMNAECIVQFYEYGSETEFGMSDEYKNMATRLYIYDLCIRAFGPNADRNQYILLNIAPKHLNITRTDIDQTYEEQRDITGMKVGQMTNLDMKQYQHNGYPILTGEEESKDMKEQELAEGIVEQNYLQKDYIVSTQIQKSEVVEWKDISEVFRSQGSLQKMAERYKNENGYGKDRLKVLLLDISYIGKEEMSEFYLSIYEHTWLFTRDSNGKRWIFGTADDWIVLSNDVHPERTGHINTEWITEEQTVTVQAAYILPPDIWEKEEALYFCSGIEWTGLCDAVAEIKLK